MNSDPPTAHGPLSRSMLSDSAYAALHARIISLDLRPGQRLNIERLAGDLGVSPTPLREALGRLAAEDLVRVEPYKGFFVAELLDDDELADLADVRALIESHAVVRGAARIGSVLDDMRREIELMDRLIEAPTLNIRAFSGADARLHTALISAADSPTLTRTYDKLNVHAQIARLFAGRGNPDARTANDEHKRIVAALEFGDVEKARDEVTDHIMNVVDRLTPRDE
jgi:DNA-binding GntR family transcriptional regulator